ncbi:MAG: sugar phosphate isomerase/epimerase [Fidelibacterota bacterium]|nr:MAG: sugar phosphate isomerase/epimerase [Candidatus Neomarinimicrobiota bacterium]
MKLSIVLSTQPASFKAIAYQGNLKRNIANIARLGYDGVELAVRDPKLLDFDMLEAALINSELPVPAIGTGQAYGEEGLSLTSRDEGIRSRAIKRVRSHAGLAAQLGAVVIIGLVRGKSEGGRKPQQTLDQLLESLRECARTNPGVKFAIEPINRYETDLVNTVASGLDLVNRLGLENVGLLLDTFHMNIEEPDMLASIRQARERLFHFHVADSNRWYPGAGHIDFKAILEVLNQIGYSGFVSAEILPLPDPATAAEKTIENMRALVA